MDYEKAYKEALAKAREIHRNEDEKRFDMEWLFSELKESEDERIRKDLLAFIKAPYVYDFIVHDRVDPWIAWLEKQGVKKKGWSEEDENMANDLIEGFLSSEKTHHLVHTSKEIVDWLKSLKDRMKGKEEKK